MRVTSIPREVDELLEREWRLLSENEKANLAESIVTLSNHFQDPSGLLTPWERAELEMAYRFYFFPLNLARGVSLFQSLEGLLTKPLKNLYDIGAGLGNLAYLQRVFPRLLEGPITSIERNPRPGAPPSLQNIPQHLSEDSVGFFSFSWVETKTPLEELKNFKTLIFLEPSTSHVARRLMTLRQELIDAGFFALAPCTHNLACPLLIHSQKDWCHDRVHFEKPDWFMELENLLPMKNNSLTYTYLLMSKSLLFKTEGLTRVIGDTLKEKGKTRQAICFDNERRFLSWLKRNHKEIPRIDHGKLISIHGGEEKGSEIRVKETTHIEEFEPDRNTENP